MRPTSYRCFTLQNLIRDDSQIKNMTRAIRICYRYMLLDAAVLHQALEEIDILNRPYRFRLMICNRSDMLSILRYA